MAHTMYDSYHMTHMILKCSSGLRNYQGNSLNRKKVELETE